MAAQYLTMAEIEKIYPNEWVLLDRPRIGRGEQVLGGYVLAHSPDRDEFDRQLGELPGGAHFAVRYTGVGDPDEIFLLNVDL